MDPVNVLAKFEAVTFPVPDVIAMEFWAEVANLKPRKRGRKGREWYRSKERRWLPIGTP